MVERNKTVLHAIKVQFEKGIKTSQQKLKK